MTDIDCLRKEIESIDIWIIKLMAERKDIARKIGRLKKKNGLPILDSEREKTLKNIWTEKAKGLDLDCDTALRILNEILVMSKNVQEGVVE